MLLGLRDQTIDVDIKLDPEPEGAFDAIAKLKNSLGINIELASPDNFIPVPKSWRADSLFIDRFGDVDFYHFDFKSQALAKIERGHDQDIADVIALIENGHVSPESIKSAFNEIRISLARYPAISLEDFERKMGEIMLRVESNKC